MTTRKERDLSSPELSEVEEVETEENEAVEHEPAAIVKRVMSGDEIIESDDFTIEEVPVPEWGGKGAVVFVKSMTGFERDKFEESLQGKEGGTNLTNIRAKFVVETVVDGNGNRLLSADKVAKMGKKNAKPLNRCFTVARRLSGFSEEDIDELAKNS